MSRPSDESETFTDAQPLNSLSSLFDKKSTQPKGSHMCTICQKDYTTNFNLRRHIRRWHSTPEKTKTTSASSSTAKKPKQEVETVLAAFQLLVVGDDIHNCNVTVNRLF